MVLVAENATAGIAMNEKTVISADPGAEISTPIDCPA